jgi:hypothetical protein
VARVAAVLLLVFGLLPWANWIPGGHSAPWYGERLSLWLSGGAITLGVALIATIGLRRRPQLWPAGKWGSISDRWRTAGWRADLAIAGLVAILYATVSQLVLSAQPLLIDEIIQVYQAGIFAGGRLFLPSPEHLEFTAAMHLVDHAGKVYGQFPAGGPAMLALGVAVGAAWLVGPLFAALGVLAFARVLRRTELMPGTALAALLLAALAPFTVFLAGSMMNHVTTSTWLMLAVWALVVATESHEARPRSALLAGLALGIAATIRPMDAVAFALPAAAWLAWRARKGWHHGYALIASGIGVAIPLAILMYINVEWTGDPLRFGYIELWGKTHELGFHEAPWGEPHTPLRGLELINLYLLRLQNYLFETPLPALGFATLAMLLVRRVSALDRYVMVASATLLMAYWAYWHDGFYLGPRFLLPLTPWLALWTARLPAVLRDRGFSIGWERGAIMVGVTAAVMGVTMLLPIRVKQYQNGMLSMRWDVAAIADSAGVADETILVRESWGAQMVARMWGLGMPRPDAEWYYKRVDACALEHAIDRTEIAGDSAAGLRGRLSPVLPDSGRLVALRESPDTTLRLLPGAPYTPRCVERVREDQAGFALYPPLLVVEGNRYIRDLHQRDTLLFPSGESMPKWLLVKDQRSVNSPPRLLPLNPDSLRQAWWGQ